MKMKKKKKKGLSFWILFDLFINIKCEYYLYMLKRTVHGREGEKIERKFSNMAFAFISILFIRF